METSHLGIIFNKIKKLFRKILKKRNKETETIIQNTEENNMLQETIYYALVNLNFGILKWQVPA
jgi:hypothetical protein